MVGLLGRDDGSVGGQREVDAWVRHQVGLELGQVHVEGTIEAQGSGDGGHDLADQAVEVGVGGSLDVQVAAADVVDCFVVDHEGTVGVLQGSVGGQDGVVRFNHCCRHLKRRLSIELVQAAGCWFFVWLLDSKRGSIAGHIDTNGIQNIHIAVC